MPNKATVTTRSQLLSLLTEACELEHGIACSYLFAAFSLKQDESEGISWEELQRVRRWAGQIYFVASQEMLHLSLVWNLLTAIGGTPYYLRPNFPQSSRYYPLNLPLELERFGPQSMRRFVLYEHPREVSVERDLPGLFNFDGFDAQEFRFSTVGELYDLILSGFETIPEAQLFLGNPNQQVGPDLIDFPNIVKVTDRASAKAAIDEITEQGEGTVEDREDSHFGAFVSILEELRSERHTGKHFEPARRVLKNPAATNVGDYAASANVLTDPVAAELAALFDSVYSAMLRMLAYVFVNNGDVDPDILRRMASSAISMMPRVLQPLGEALTLMPAGDTYPGLSAGPGFGLTRHVSLPRSAKVARLVISERLAELAVRGQAITSRPGVPVSAARACVSLGQIAAGLTAL